MLSAFLEAITGRAPDMLRAYLLAVVIQMAAVNALGHYGYLHTTVRPFFGLATAAGGFVFGLGMVLAMGCAGSVLSRAGEGKLDYLVVIIAYAAGAWASNRWVVSPLRRFLNGQVQSLPLPVTPPWIHWVAIAAAALGTTAWVLRGERRPYHGGWDWSLTGLLVGSIGVAAWVASAITGAPAGLGAVSGSLGLGKVFLERDMSGLDWSLFVMLAIPMGAHIAAQLEGGSPGRPVRSARVVQALVGGAIMGLGAALADGENVTHGLGGVPLLAVSSVTFMLSAFLGTWIGVKLGWLAPKEGSPSTAAQGATAT